MKQQIDQLIANTLLTRGEVWLPGIGSLILRRRAAVRLSASRLQQPYRELRFTSEQRGGSVVALIAATAAVNEARAEAIYAQWVAQSRKEGGVTITSLCRIEQGNVIVDQDFEIMANPKGRGVVKINPRTNYMLYAFVALTLLFAVGVAGYTLYTNNTFDSLLTRETTAEHIVEAPSIATPTAEIVAVEAPIVEAASVATTTTEDDLMPLDDEKAKNLKRGSSYAVWGVYKEIANAEAAVARLAKQYDDLDAAIYNYGSKYMVALCELPSRAACARKVEALRARSRSFKEVWVYTDK